MPAFPEVSAGSTARVPILLRAARLTGYFERLRSPFEVVNRVG